MMRVLLVKTSSMGDVIHTLPALTDAAQAMPDIQFDWVVEEAFAEIPKWHPTVNKVIPVALRRWRKNLLSARTRSEWAQFRRVLRAEKYDLIIDAQGLLKSAFIALLAHGPRAGLDFYSAREAAASLLYAKKYSVDKSLHAVMRTRALIAAALHYPVPVTLPQFGIDRKQLSDNAAEDKYLVFLHGTTWVSKEWPEQYWIDLAQLAKEQGYRVKIGGGSEAELARAGRIAAACDAVDALPRMSIDLMARLLAGASGAVAVDTGFGHLAAAMNLPTISIYGATNPGYTGALGQSSVHLSADFPCSPCMNRICTYKEPAPVTPACYTTVKPERVWLALSRQLGLSVVAG